MELKEDCKGECSGGKWLGLRWDGGGGGAKIGLGASKKGCMRLVWPEVDTWLLWGWQEFPQSCIRKMNSTVYIPTTLHLFCAP